jgi:hypothetical protein
MSAIGPSFEDANPSEPKADEATNSLLFMAQDPVSVSISQQSRPCHYMADE